MWYLLLAGIGSSRWRYLKRAGYSVRGGDLLCRVGIVKNENADHREVNVLDVKECSSANCTTLTAV